MFTGYVDIGTQLDSDEIPEAREVLCFMLVALNAAWKIPVGYFLLDGISSSEKADLLGKCLEFVHESGVIVTSITFDGAPTNLAMAEKLGANFKDIANLKTTFKHPITDEDVFIILDPCHMIKLVRNCFGSQKVLEDTLNNKNISWHFINKLVDKQYSEGLHAATKIKLRHLDWTKEKMKVKLAVQTLSRSVSDALISLSSQFPEFALSSGTSTFIRYFNDLFDIFNSRNRFVKYKFKLPLSPKNAGDIFPYLNSIEEYIRHIKLGDKLVTKSNRKTGFLGFLICINSLKQFYPKYVGEAKPLKYLLTYKLSQDHLELFFGAIRSKGGHNNNPTARQFEAAYKRLIVHLELVASQTGNVQDLESIPILTCGSGNNITINEDGQHLDETPEYIQKAREVMEEINPAFLNSKAWDLTDYVQDIVAYIAGYVVKTLKKCITCIKCLSLLEGEVSKSKLQIVKEYGSLIKASSLVVDVCKEGEQIFRIYTKTKKLWSSQNIVTILTNETIKCFKSFIYNYFGDHLFEDDPVDGHASTLIKLILKHYFKIRIFHETNKKLDISLKRRVRSTFTKMTLFKNQ